MSRLPAHLDAIEITRRKKAESLPGRTSFRYYVVGWGGGRILGIFAKLAKARKWARARGHEPDAVGKWYPPLAYVENAQGECVYNPRFRVSRRG
jgi:hypothetical protein